MTASMPNGGTIWGIGVLLVVTTGVVVAVMKGSDDAAPAAPSPISSSSSGALTPPASVAPGSPSSPPASNPNPTTSSPKDNPDGQVEWTGNGQLRAVDIDRPGPGGKRLMKLHFQVEDGVTFDRRQFAELVVNTVNDDRSWRREGWHFAAVPTAGAADRVVILASPATSERMCKPLRTFGKTSCQVGNKVIFSNFRWMVGTPEFKSDVALYRRYVINHEMGHAVGKGHVACPGPGKTAPIMQQQTLRVAPCVPNDWPYP